MSGCVRRQRAAAKVERLADQCPRAVVLVARAMDPGQVDETARKVARRISARGAADRDGLLEAGLGLVQPSKVVGHLADHVEQPRLDNRLVRQIVGANGAALQQVQCRELGSRAIARLAAPEQLEQEFGDALRFGERLLGAVALARRALPLSYRDAQAGDQRHDHDCCGGRFDTVPAQELLQAIPAIAAMRQHRQSGEMPLHILAQHVGRCVTARRLLPHRHQDDAVEIATEELRQAPIGRGDARARRRRILLADDSRHLQR